jgi:hypothetical protein
VPNRILPAPVTLLSATNTPLPPQTMFEAASIKPNHSRSEGGGVSTSHGRYAATNIGLKIDEVPC